MSQDATETRFLTTDDGVRIAVHCHGSGPARALLVPGTFSNHSFWLGTRGVGFARFLAQQGFETWTLDPRGHGASDRDGEGKHWDFDDWARHDVACAIRAAASEQPIFLIGHSAGGSAALAALAAEPALRAGVRAVVAIATPLPWLQGWKGMAARLVLASTYLMHRFPARLLRLGPEDELTGVMRQWTRWNLGGRWIGDDGTDYGRQLADLDIPALVVAGAGDRFWAPPAACKGLYDLVGSPHKSFLLCGRHAGFTRDFGHVDIVVSPEARSEVWPLLGNWLRAERDRSATRCWE